MNYIAKHAQIVADTVKAQNTDFLASDVTLNRDSTKVRISIAVSTAVKVRLVPSSGSGFYLNSGSALVAAAVHTEDAVLDKGRTWNVQTDDAAGTTVTHLLIQELEA